ncbi:TPA: hypothetical protein ACH3X1_003138 [Trebouxia sp. C0004]
MLQSILLFVCSSVAVLSGRKSGKIGTMSQTCAWSLLHDSFAVHRPVLAITRWWLYNSWGKNKCCRPGGWLPVCGQQQTCVPSADAKRLQAASGVTFLTLPGIPGSEKHQGKALPASSPTQSHVKPADTRAPPKARSASSTTALTGLVCRISHACRSVAYPTSEGLWYICVGMSMQPTCIIVLCRLRDSQQHAS